MNTPIVIQSISRCRVCAGKNLQRVLNLGTAPPANSFLKKSELKNTEKKFPLELFFCKDCSFVQLGIVVPPHFMYANYIYVSSTSLAFVQHFEQFVHHVIQKLGLAPNDLVIDIGSNDGILLKPFKENGMRTLGIEPAEKIAALANQNGIETIPSFFSVELARQVRAQYGKAKLITATNVFSHVDDVATFVQGIQEVLADDGVFVIEVYYLAELLRKNLFDLIYHEHLSYFTVKTISDLLQRLHWSVFDVELTGTHGGSIRVYCQKQGSSHVLSDSVHQLMEREKNEGLQSIETYFIFAKKIEENKQSLRSLLTQLNTDHKIIVGYGAAAKANTLLNYFEINSFLLDYIVDDNTWKQGLYTPGTHIPVVSSRELKNRKPDYVLILAWNFANSIMQKCAPVENFILPVPVPAIITPVVENDLVKIAKAIQLEARALEGKTILITGGSGFVGSYMVATLDYLNQHVLKKPCTVLAVDNHLVGSKNNLIKTIESNHVHFITHDVCKPLDIAEPIDYIVSAAGVASPVYYKKYPLQTIEGTVFGMKNALELARQKKIKSMLFFSSSEIYGDPSPDAIPTPETYKGNVSSIGPRSCYDESKRIAETLAMAYHSAYAVPVKIVRPFNVFGPGMKGADFRVIPRFLSEGIAHRPLPVHDKGNQTRTFCYATDAIVGFFKVLLSGKNGSVYNVGNDADEMNMLALGHLISKSVFNGSIEVQLIHYPEIYPQDEPKRRCPDLSKIRTELEYVPNVDLRTGLHRHYEWLLTSEFT